MSPIDEDPWLRTGIDAYLRSTAAGPKVVAVYTQLDRSPGLKYFECDSVADGDNSGLPLLAIPGLAHASSNSMVPMVNPDNPVRCKVFGKEVTKPTSVDQYLYPSQANIKPLDKSCPPGYLAMYDVVSTEDGTPIHTAYCVSQGDSRKCTMDMDTQKLNAAFGVGDWCLTRSLRKRGYTKQCPLDVRHPCTPAPGNLTCAATPSADSKSVQGWEHTLTQAKCDPPSVPSKTDGSPVNLDYNAPVSVDVANNS